MHLHLMQICILLAAQLLFNLLPQRKSLVCCFLSVESICNLRASAKKYDDLVYFFLNPEAINVF